MAAEHVEMVRRSMEAFNRRDMEGLIDSEDRVIALYWWRGRASASGISVGVEVLFSLSAAGP